MILSDFILIQIKEQFISPLIEVGEFLLKKTLNCAGWTVTGAYQYFLVTSNGNNVFTLTLLSYTLPPSNFDVMIMDSEQFNKFVYDVNNQAGSIIYTAMYTWDLTTYFNGYNYYYLHTSGTLPYGTYYLVFFNNYEQFGAGNYGNARFWLTISNWAKLWWKIDTRVKLIGIKIKKDYHKPHRIRIRTKVYPRHTRFIAWDGEGVTDSTKGYAFYDVNQSEYLTFLSVYGETIEYLHATGIKPSRDYDRENWKSLKEFVKSKGLSATDTYLARKQRLMM